MEDARQPVKHQTGLNGEPPVEVLSIKDQVTAHQVTQGIIDGKTITQIAQDMGISRPALYARMSKTGVQELMVLEVRELETKLQTWIQELHDSPSQASKRHAATELGKIVKHVTDKVYPSIFRHETINVNLDLTRHQQREHILTETLNRLPPTIRTAFWQTYNTVTQELTPQ